MPKRTILIFGIFVVVFFGVGIWLYSSSEPSLAYWVTYVIFVVSGFVSMKIFKNTSLHKEISVTEKVIIIFSLVMIAIYNVVRESELVALFQENWVEAIISPKFSAVFFPALFHFYVMTLLRDTVLYFKNKEN